MKSGLVMRPDMTIVNSEGQLYPGSEMNLRGRD